MAVSVQGDGPSLWPSTSDTILGLVPTPRCWGKCVKSSAQHLSRVRCSPVADDLNGLRLGVPEVVRAGMGPGDMPELARLIRRALGNDPEGVAPEAGAFRRRFTGVHFVAA